MKAVGIGSPGENLWLGSRGGQKNEEDWQHPRTNLEVKLPGLEAQDVGLGERNPG